MKPMRNFLEHVSQYCELEIKRQKFLIFLFVWEIPSHFLCILNTFCDLVRLQSSRCLKNEIYRHFFFLDRQKILKAILVEKYDKTNEIHFKCTLETSECFYHVRIFKLILSALLFIMICNNIYLFCSLSSVDATKFPAAKCFLFHKRARNYKMSIDFYENKDLL